MLPYVRHQSLRFLTILLLMLAAEAGLYAAQAPPTSSAPAHGAVRPEPVPQTGHSVGFSEWVLAVSSDGRWLASQGGDDYICIWQTTNWLLLRCFSAGAKNNQATSLAFHPSGQWLAAGHADNYVRIWDPFTGALLRAWSGHTRRVSAVAYSHDGMLLASGGMDKTIKLWDAQTGREVRALTGHSLPVDCLAFGPDDKSLASAGSVGTLGLSQQDEYLIPAGRPETPEVKVWDVSSGRVVSSQQWEGPSVGSECSFSATGELLAADEHVLEVHSGQSRQLCDGRCGGARFSSGGQWLVVYWSSDWRGSSRELRIWDLRAVKIKPKPGRKQAEHQAHFPEPTVIIDPPGFDWWVAPDGSWLASKDKEVGTTESWLTISEVPSGRELAALKARAARIASVVFSPDGRWLATLGNDYLGDGVMRIWDVTTGQIVHVVSDNVENVVFSPDGRLLTFCMHCQIFSSRAVGIHKLWETASGRELRSVETADNPREPAFCGFASDGRWLAVQHEGQDVILRDMTTGMTTGLTLCKSCSASHPTASPDGRWLVLDEGRMWDLKTGREVELELGGFVAFSSDGRWLVTHSAGSYPWQGPPTHPSYKVWETGTWKQVFATSFVPEHLPNSGDGVSISADGQWLGLAPVGWGQRAGFLVSVRQQDAVGAGRQVRTLPRSSSQVFHSTFSSDARWLASSSGVGATIKLWEVATGREVRTLSGHSDGVMDVAFSPDGRYLASGSYDKTIKLWEVATGREVRTFAGHTDVVDAVAFSPDSRWLASGSWDNTIKLWEVESGRTVRTLAGHTRDLKGVAFSPDGRWLASGSEDKTIKLWELESGREVRSLTGQTEGIGAVLFSPDGRLLASDGDGTVRLWEVATGQELRRLEGFLGAFSRDGRTLAYRSHGITLWNVASGRELKTEAYPAGGAAALVFAPDGDLLASGFLDNNHVVTLWTVGAGPVAARPVAPTLKGHTAELTGITFSSDGRWVVTSGQDGTTRIWDPGTGTEVALLSMMRHSGDWLVVTPEGFFDGSPTGIQKLVAWRFGNEPLPPEIFFNEFYYPGLLAEILAGRKPRAPRDIAQVDRRQPQVKLGMSSAKPTAQGPVATRTVTVKLEASEAPAGQAHPAGSGVRDLRLFRNGSLVKVWRGDVLTGKAGRATLEATVPIVAGENRFTAYAFNRDNIKSADAVLVVTGAESLRRSGTAYILAIGINQYANPDYRLSYAVPDARVFAQELQRQQMSLGKFGQVEVISLLDQDATKANILRAFARLAGQETGPLPTGAPTALAKLKPAQPEDAVFVYYAGHGTAAGPRFYLIPHDLGYSGGREAVDAAALKTIFAHSVSDIDLEHAFEKVDAGRLVLVIDACNSGQALEAEEKRRGPMNSKGLAQLAYEKGMYILTAAQGYQAALEVGELGHGLLTYALVEEGLKSPAADSAPKDGQVVLREWLDYATLRVPQMQQTAMQEARKMGREVAFVGGEEKIKDLDKRSLQRPRVFYRREPEPEPLVVARPNVRP